MGHVVHWDEVERHSREAHGMRATWTFLGDAAGTVGAGVRRIEIAPGDHPTPPHAHGAEEEIFYVLGGSGLSWQDGATYEIGEGDCLVHRRTAEAHTLVGGPDGLDVLAFGTRVAVEACVLPRAQAAWLASSWTEVGGPDPWAREETAGPLEVPAQTSPRPDRIVALRDVDVDAFEHGEHAADQRNLARAGGSEVSGLRHVEIAPGRRGWPAHCHAAEEEIFVVLAGSGVLTLGADEVAVRRGTVVARPPATRVTHAFQAGDDGLTYLAYGTREPNDIAYFPGSAKVYIRGVGIIARVEQLDYWDGV
jgi:uncharacterized cupin superfamily protein